ncbi:hypothetical protein OAI02_00215 [Candidatus Pseudothioglobus singularis]|nr:hypothetical protein [Candidatus Pseudothioglobus singularis]MDB4846902.1 hypothetical protein [Candidatus Pseudothioglobus singularis]
MKKLFILLVLSIGLSNTSNSEVSNQYIERETMEYLCQNIECPSDAREGFKKYFKARGKKAMAINVIRVPEKKKKVMTFWAFDYGNPPDSYWRVYYNSNIAKERALESCLTRAPQTQLMSKARRNFAFLYGFGWKHNSIGSYVSKNRKNYHDQNCKVIFANSNIETNLFNRYITPSKCLKNYINSPSDSNACIKIPQNAYADYGQPSGWDCNPGYTKLTSSCLQIPENAHAISSASWECDKGYSIDNDIRKPTCKIDLVIPTNAKASGLTFLCNDSYYKDSSNTSCLKVPNNAKKLSNDKGWACNQGFTKAANNCIKVPTNAKVSGSSWACNPGFTKAANNCIKVPTNAKASGSSFMCNSGYYKNSSSTGCLKVPANAKKRSNDKGWSCNTGFTKTGATCTNTAELERINKAKKIAEEKAAKERKAAQLEAQNYYRDLELFLKNNGSEYEIITIVKLMNKNKVILTQPWDEVLAKNFAELKSFTATSKAFRDYHQSRNDARQRVVLNKFDKANARLKNINAYLNNYLINNITSEIAPEVIDQLDIAAAGLKKQSLDELSKVSTQLESFIAKNKLSKDYLAFVKSLSNATPDEPKVTAKEIDATDLVNFDFMKEANRSDYIALINLTGKAPNALLDLEGSIVFENDRAVSCFYQSKDTIKNDLKYYLYDKFSDKEFLVQDRGFECNQNNLLSYDLVFFEKGTLLKETKSYVASLAAAIAYNELQLYKKVTKEDREKDFDYRAAKVRQIIEGIEDEMLLGFGSLIIDNDNTTLCTDVENSLGQASIMNLLSNEFKRMGYGKSVGNVTFSSVEDTFAKVQRGRCGFIYANEESLSKLLNALKTSGTKYDILPIWYSKKMVKNEQLRQESKNQSELIAMQKVKEQKDKDKKLAEQRAQAELEALKASGALKAAEQKRLQARHRNAVEAHIQVVEKEAALLLDKDPENTGPMLSLYPSLDNYMKDKLKEGWELDSFSVEISDFGLGNFRGRMIETFITDINFRLKNRVLGEYSPSCARVAIIDDLEFDMLREPELESCKEGSMNTYKQKLNFQSTWLVQ